MDDTILVINGGSSSLKFALFSLQEGHCVGRGAIKGFGGTTRFKAEGLIFTDVVAPAMPPCGQVTEAVDYLLGWLKSCAIDQTVAAIGHRVVHGGTDFTGPVLVTPGVIKQVERLSALAPLHQPFSLAAIGSVAAHLPDVPQIACFDTAFHATMPALHRRFALPRLWHDRGVRRYGFHGLSYEYIADKFGQISTAERVIVAHLGSGASLCALKKGKSFDTSMGFSALDGLVMGTRPGTLDVGAVLYFLQQEGMKADDLAHMLYHESGLRGVSGISADMEVLLACPDTAARDAVDLFCHRVIRETGALIALLGGLDAFVFTGGIGEHAPVIRARIAGGLAAFGLLFDEKKNDTVLGGAMARLSRPSSETEIWMIPTDEESMIARHARDLMFG